MRHGCRSIVLVAIVLGVASALAGSIVLPRSAVAAPKMKKKASKKIVDASSSAEDTDETRSAKSDEPEEEDADDSESPAPATVARGVVSIQGAAEPGPERKSSKVTPGTASRWSNRGAMVPIESEVPITAPLPERAVPIAPGVETPGQSLIGGEELLEARIFFSASHLATGGQNYVYGMDAGKAVLLEGKNRDIDLLRGRATLSYERIASSDFGLHLDLEYRGRLAGSRPSDNRVNELYLSWGLTDFRQRGAPDFGVAVGRVVAREAGYAQADGVLFRLRVSDALTLGVLGGVTGNPYGYNWGIQKDQEFSTRWLRGGVFSGYRTDRLFANSAIVATYARLAGLAARGQTEPTKNGLDRLYLYADIAYLLTETVNLMGTGWFDVVGGHTFQNVEVVLAYRPIAPLDFRLGVGRFSTVIYDQSAAYSYAINPNANPAGSAVVVDEAGNPIVPFDAVIGSTIYNSVRGRVGYQLFLPLDLFASADLLVRDSSFINTLTQEANGAKTPVAGTRLVPGGGVRYHDPNIIDARLEVAYFLDGQSQADAMVHGAIGRSLFDLYVQVDLRSYLGGIGALNGGLDLTYMLPRSWFPGRVFLRGTLRLYKEAVSLRRPDPTQSDIINTFDQLIPVPSQKSMLGFASLEWRL